MGGWKTGNNSRKRQNNVPKSEKGRDLRSFVYLASQKKAKRWLDTDPRTSREKSSIRSCLQSKPTEMSHATSLGPSPYQVHALAMSRLHRWGKHQPFSQTEIQLPVPTESYLMLWEVLLPSQARDWEHVVYQILSVNVAKEFGSGILQLCFHSVVFVSVLMLVPKKCCIVWEIWIWWHSLSQNKHFQSSHLISQERRS